MRETQDYSTPQSRIPLRQPASWFLLFSAFTIAGTTPLAGQVASAGDVSLVVTGTVRNGTTGSPVRLAAVRLAGGAASALTNDLGRYRIVVPSGAQQLEVRRLGYRPAAVTITVTPQGATADVRLEPIAVGLARVIVTGQDDAARRIIAAAIRRKQETRGQLHDYRYDGDVRLVVRDLTKPADSAKSVVLVTQTRTSAYWEQPNRYQETIVARRQTGNLDAQQNLVGVGQIVNFSQDRVSLGRFELPSPVADDALDRYDYHVLDTLASGGRRIFRLSLEPRSDGSPAFAGVIDIADSTFDVTGIDVGVNSAVRLRGASNVRYQQRFSDVAGRWLPRSIELSLDIRIPIAKIQYRIEQLAELSGFRFNEGRRPAGLDEYRIVVADSADRADSATWSDARAIPLSAVERAAFIRIDSIRNAPKSARQRVLGAVGNVLVFVTDPDLFHYDRVDGAYLGFARSWPDPRGMPGTEPSLKVGYSDGGDRWQYRVGERLRLSEAQRVWIGASLHDETLRRATFTSAGYNPTLWALVSRVDPLDYYRERGLVGTLTSKVVNFVRLDATLRDVRQSSLPVTISRPPLRLDASHVYRPNDPIADGHLRSVATAFTYDSRSLLRQGGRDVLLGAPRWTRLVMDMEASPGAAGGSDFAYQRYTLRLERRQQSLGLGITSLSMSAGGGSTSLPPQRFFGVDGGAQVLAIQASPFSTLVDSSISAPRAAVVALQHDFDRLLFTRSGLPLVRDIPFTLSVRGSVFWAGAAEAGSRQPAIRAPYEEAGFTIGNLTPFLAPFNFSARFAWQLSHYPTTPFRLSLGLGS